jgi:ATP-binding cassette subfamily B protein
MTVQDRPTAAPPPLPGQPQVRVAGDLAEDGRAGRRWVIVADGEVRVVGAGGTWPPQGPSLGVDAEGELRAGRLILAPPPPPDAAVLRRLPLSEVTGARVEPFVGSGALMAETREGPVLLVRHSAALAPDFGLAARALSSLAQGGEPEVDPRDLPRHCPRCGRRLPANSRVCGSCVDRGAVLQRILRYAAPYRAELVLSMALTLVASFVTVLPPKLYQWITNALVYRSWPLGGALGRGAAGLGTLVGLLLAVSLAGVLLQVWRGRVANWVGSHVMGDIRTGLWEGVQRLSLSYFDKAQLGEIMNRVSVDTNRMQDFLTEGAPFFLTEMLQLAFAVVLMFTMNWRLALVAILPGPVMVVMSYACWPLIRRYDRQLWAMMARLNVVVNDALSGIRVVKAFGQERRETSRFNRVSDRLVAQNVITNNIWATVFPIFSFVSGLGSILIWYVGGVLVLGHSMQIGTIVAFTGYMGLLLGPLQWISNLINWMTRAITSAERVFEVLDTEPDVVEAEDAEPIGRIEGRVQVRGVHFGYAPHLPVIRGIDLEVEPGEMIGLVGQSGAGKSTLINLLCRLYDPDQGSISVDGHDLRRLRQDDLRSQFGVVLQDSFLFDGTIAENIAYARPESSPEEIMRAARIANAHEFIVKQPDGYDTLVGERGARLSGGERQRIAIARAILHDPRILILDEATASVDTQTERAIQEAIARLVRGRTTFAIAHRLSTLRGANRLVVLDKGRVVESGTHDELMARNGRYAALVNAQRENARLAGEVGIGV